MPHGATDREGQDDGGTAIRPLHVANAFAVAISTAGAADSPPTLRSVGRSPTTRSLRPAATPTAPA